MMRNFAAYAFPVLLAITLHEAAHAYAAKYLGDPTAYEQGRMSLNPAKHIDPIGTLLIPLVLYFLKAPFMFGYAKPVPVEMSRLRNPRRDMALVALAGPAANLLMAVLWVNFGALLPVLGVYETFFYEVAKAGVYINLVFFALNLLPLPPLDGGRILTSLLPPRLGHKFARIEPYGFFVVLALLVTGLIMHWMVPVATFGASVVQALSFV